MATFQSSIITNLPLLCGTIGLRGGYFCLEVVSTNHHTNQCGHITGLIITLIYSVDTAISPHLKTLKQKAEMLRPTVCGLVYRAYSVWTGVQSLQCVDWCTEPTVCGLVYRAYSVRTSVQSLLCVD